MTLLDYNMVMAAIRIADLKARLSAHLRSVRAGRTITILDRDTPIARIVPYEHADAGFTVRLPAQGAGGLRDIELPPPLRLRRDIVELLLEERQISR